MIYREHWKNSRSSFYSLIPTFLTSWKFDLRNQKYTVVVVVVVVVVEVVVVVVIGVEVEVTVGVEVVVVDDVVDCDEVSIVEGAVDVVVAFISVVFTKLVVS
jgi:hypothetical protein